MSPKIRIDVLNGPNLNLLGRCQRELYGEQSLAQIEQELRSGAPENVELHFLQSNHQGVLIDVLQGCLDNGCAGILINPGPLRHTSQALRETLLAVGLPAVEVHLTAGGKKEFRHDSLLGASVLSQEHGTGAEAYRKALARLLSKLKAA